MKNTNKYILSKIVGILGYGEIGSNIAKICKEAGFSVLVRDLKYDQLKGRKVDYLHINIPEKNKNKFIKIVVKNVKELSPSLTIINSSVTPGTTREIFKKTNLPIIHSPVIGVHPNIYDSIKSYFPKIIGAVNSKSLSLAKKHFKELGLSIEVYDSPETSEVAKLLDIAYYAWNIIFCKWIAEICNKLNLNFDQIYTLHNKIYNQGYKIILPNVTRPILVPVKGLIGGHCIIPDTVLFDKFYKNRFTQFILEENKKYLEEQNDDGKNFKVTRTKLIKTTLKKNQQ